MLSMCDCCVAVYPRLSLCRLIEDRSGATAIEYGLIAALVSVAGITAFDFLGGSLSVVFSSITDAVAVARCVEVGSNCNQ